jgi:hypothetical protein
VTTHQSVAIELYADFARRMTGDLAGYNYPDVDALLAKVHDPEDQRMLRTFHLFNKSVTSTNLWKKSKSAAAFRMDPAVFLKNHHVRARGVLCERVRVRAYESARVTAARRCATQQPSPPSLPPPPPPQQQQQHQQQHSTPIPTTTTTTTAAATTITPSPPQQHHHHQQQTQRSPADP